ncbi:MAG: phosphomannomutase/phosphoglucomutase [Planctomycetes bacterium]|nr:phosphomannomutase/phosphoglucomutase [Planctomycetota bacterium]
MGIFKAYDVRGRYPTEIDEAFARRLGRAVAAFLNAKTMAVGRDVRKSAPAIAKAVLEGLQAGGVEVLDLGLCTTPMLYYAVGSLELGGGVMITASHNPPDDIGFKICRERAFPIGERTGLKDLERLVNQPAPERRGSVRPIDIVPAYRAHLRRFIGKIRPMTVAVDTANGCVGAHFDALFDGLPARFERLCFPPDGSFPNHEPNPLKDENVRDLQKRLRETRCDLGVAFDGDGDRCMFFRPNGERIPSDLVTVLLARRELERSPGAAVVYDLRSSWVVREEIEKAGGRALRERVGHAFIKETMKHHDAVLGGELSGHYYFKENFFADSGLLAFAKVLDLLGGQPKGIDELLRPFQRYHATGELNFHVADKQAVIERIASAFNDGRQDRLDGITVEYDDWWLNVRPSNTEPLLRLNLEAKSPDLRDRMRGQVERLIQG